MEKNDGGDILADEYDPYYNLVSVGDFVPLERCVPRYLTPEEKKREKEASKRFMEEFSRKKSCFECND